MSAMTVDEFGRGLIWTGVAYAGPVTIARGSRRNADTGDREETWIVTGLVGVPGQVVDVHREDPILSTAVANFLNAAAAICHLPQIIAAGKTGKEPSK